jgi:hypothetical protein
MSTQPSRRFGDDTLVLDDETVDRLLDGLVVADAPPGYGSVAELLRTVCAPMPKETAEAAEALAVRMFRAGRAEGALLDRAEGALLERAEGWRADARRVDGGTTEAGAARPGAGALDGLADVAPVAAVATAEAQPAKGWRSPLAIGPRARRAGLAAGMVAGLSLLTATSAAALTGALPGPAQRAAHDVMSAVGVHVPDPGTSRPPTTGGAPTSPALHSAPTGPPGVVPATAGDLPAPTAGRHGHGRDQVTPPAPGSAIVGAEPSARSGAGRDNGRAQGGPGDTPGHDGTGPGNSGNAPGQAGTGPDGPATVPGHGATGGSGNSPGHAVSGPGDQGNAPGHDVPAAGNGASGQGNGAPTPADEGNGQGQGQGGSQDQGSAGPGIVR